MAANGVRILEGVSSPQPNFKIIATHVRHGAQPRHYLLQDGSKIKTLIEKWRFEPKPDPLSRCGYDYLIVVTNGDVTIPISVCFVCNTLIFNHKEKYRISKKQIMALLAEDFQALR